MLENVDLYLFKVNIFNLSRCEKFLSELKLTSVLKILKIPEEEVEVKGSYFITLNDLCLESRLYSLLESLVTKQYGDMDSSKMNGLYSSIVNDKHFKISQTSVALDTVWSAIVYFLVKQWNIKIKRMILNHFKVKDSIEHLTDVEKSLIKLLGRAAHNQNPYSMLIGKMGFISDNFVLNQRVSSTFDFTTFDLNFSRLRIRGDNTAIAEMIKDHFCYKLSLNEEVTLHRNATDMQSVSSEICTASKSKISMNSTFTRSLFGSKYEIITYPMFLVIRLDRMMTLKCVDGCAVTVRSDKDFSFPEFITGEDFNVFDSQLSYCLLAAQTCKGNVYFRSGGDWIKRRSTSFVKVSEKCFEECFTNEGVEVLIYVRNIF